MFFSSDVRLEAVGGIFGLKGRSVTAQGKAQPPPWVTVRAKKDCRPERARHIAWRAKHP